MVILRVPTSFQKSAHYLKHKENLLWGVKNAEKIIILEKNLLQIAFYSLFQVI